MKRTVHLPIELIQIPSVAWPTLLVWVLASIVWGVCFYLGVFLDISPIYVLPIQTLATYVLFTPMHDAAHSSVSSSHRWINNLVGRCCAFVFAAPFPAFRYVHLQHHKFTNDPEKDPDFWSEGGPAWQKPFRWASQEFYYYYWYLCRSGSRPLSERFECYSTIAFFYGAIVFLARSGYWYQVSTFYLLPIRGALPILALLFDWLPHHRWPRLFTSIENQYKATHKLKSLFGLDLSFVTLQQSMHCIHHLWPTIPFYRYDLAWHHASKELKEAGVETWGIYPEDSKIW